jgi:Ohr subfamily peroxiredoxin
MSQAIRQIEKVIYTAKAHTTGGREGGTSQSSDGRLDVKLTTPGAKGDGTNPEQLFAAGWSSCFLSAIKLEAAATKVKLPADAAVDAEVDLGRPATAIPEPGHDGEFKMFCWHDDHASCGSTRV